MFEKHDIKTVNLGFVCTVNIKKEEQQAIGLEIQVHKTKLLEFVSFLKRTEVLRL